MKLRFVCAYFFLLLSSCAGLQGPPPFDGPAPLAILIEENPWTLIRGADVPLVALYSNGLLIYNDNMVRNEIKYRVLQLSEEELKKILGLIGPKKEFLDLHPYFALGDKWDLPTISLFLSNGDKHKMVSIYGTYIKNQELVILNTDRNVIAPREFVRVQKVLSTLSFPKATLWIPKFFEIIIWPYEHAPYQRDWPDTFPDLKDEHTIQRKNDAYSLFIEGSRKDELKTFLAQLKRNEAVVINGKNWAMFVRPVFPSEPVWKAAEKENEDVLPRNNGKQ